MKKLLLLIVLSVFSIFIKSAFDDYEYTRSYFNKDFSFKSLYIMNLINQEQLSIMKEQLNWEIKKYEPCLLTGLCSEMEENENSETQTFEIISDYEYYSKDKKYLLSK